MSSLDVDCPKCGAASGDRCRTPKTNRTTYTHSDRWFVFNGQRFEDLRRDRNGQGA